MMHIVVSESSAGVMRQALGEDARIVSMGDALSFGPLPRIVSVADWFAARRAFWHAIGSGVEHAQSDLLGTRIDDLTHSAEVTLWLGTGPDEQFFAAWFTALLDALGVAPAVNIVQFTKLRTASGKTWNVCSPAVLHPEEFLAAPSPAAVTEQHSKLLLSAWDALTMSTPAGFEDFIDMTRYQPHLIRHTMKALHNRFPSTSGGVNRWEQCVMRHLHDRGPNLVHAIGWTLSDAWDHGDPVGDAWLYWRVRRLADPALVHPLLELDELTYELRGRQARLTRHGEAVLEGSENAVLLNGIDDWVAGVHLQYPRGPAWFTTGTGLLPVAAAIGVRS